MKKRLILRCLLGAPIGLSISYLITIAASIATGDGNYYPAVPELIQVCGTEINAVILQTACALFYGLFCGGASIIWEIEEWSLLRMTATHLIICCIVIFPIAYFMRWMPHNLKGFLLYFGLFFAVYFFIWITQYSSMKRKIEQLNRKVQERN